MFILHCLMVLSAGLCPPTKCNVVSVSQPGIIAVARVDATSDRPVLVRSGVSEPGSTATAPTGITVAVLGSQKDDEDDANIAAGGPWLGIQFGPVPKPLAVHLNLPDGVGQMILNVVKDSPADDVGFGQYDVIVALDGEDVSSDIESFLDVVRTFAPGDTHRVSYYQGGKRIDSDIQVGTRPAEFGGYKYEHQPEAISRSRVFGRSGMLEKDDEGNWVFKGFDSEHMPKFWVDIPELKDLDFNFDFQFPGLDKNVFIHRGGKGQSVRIERDADGRITVSKTATEDDRKETTSKTYENEDELQREDPEAYDLFKSGGGATIWEWGDDDSPIRFRFDGSHFGLGPDFQKKLNERIRESQKSIEELQQQWQSPKAVPGDGLRFFRRPETSFEINSDGSIRATVRKGGQELVQTFDDENAMKRTNPNLYKKFRQLQNGDDSKP